MPPGNPLRPQHVLAAAIHGEATSDGQRDISRASPSCEPHLASQGATSEPSSELKHTVGALAPPELTLPASRCIEQWGLHGARSQRGRSPRAAGTWGQAVLPVNAESDIEVESASEAAAVQALMGIGLQDEQPPLKKLRLDMRSASMPMASLHSQPSRQTLDSSPQQQQEHQEDSPRSVDQSSCQTAYAAAPPRFLCVCCRKQVALRGEKRPTFFCAHCPSKAGNQKRAQRAVLGGEATERVVTVTEAAQLLLASSALEPPSLLCKRLLRRSSWSSGGGSLNRAGSVRSVTLTGEAGGAQAEAEDTQGRCKCGKRISASHPPCKSELMLLCEKFQQRFCHLAADGAPAEIFLNDVAAALGVQRRRLYDIINVMEAVEIVQRTGKLAYEWRGTAGLPALLEQLLDDEAAGRPVEDRARKPLVHSKSSGGGGGHAHTGGGGGDREESKAAASNSLWMLSRKFVRLLLAHPGGAVPLADAAAVLVGPDNGDPKRQQTIITVERRLIDIGCILSCVDLVEKTYLGRRQPAFSWKWSWERTGSISSADSGAAHESQHLAAQTEPSIPAPVKDQQEGNPTRAGSRATNSRKASQRSRSAQAGNHEEHALPAGRRGKAAHLDAVGAELAGGSRDFVRSHKSAMRQFEASQSAQHSAQPAGAASEAAATVNKSTRRQRSRSLTPSDASEAHVSNSLCSAGIAGMSDVPPLDAGAFNSWLQSTLVQSAYPAANLKPQEPTAPAEAPAHGTAAPDKNPNSSAGLEALPLGLALQALQLQALSAELSSSLSSGLLGGNMQLPSALPWPAAVPGSQPGIPATQLPWPFGLQLHHASLALTLQLMQQHGLPAPPSLAALKGLSLGVPAHDAAHAAGDESAAAGLGIPPGLLAGLLLGTGGGLHRNLPATSACVPAPLPQNVAATIAAAQPGMTAPLVVASSNMERLDE